MNTPEKHEGFLIISHLSLVGLNVKPERQVGAEVPSHLSVPGLNVKPAGHDGGESAKAFIDESWKKEPLAILAKNNIVVIETNDGTSQTPFNARYHMA